MSEMKIEYVPLSSIEGWPRNPKKHDDQLIIDSISRFGFNDPCALDESSGKLVEGHGRIDALRAMKTAEQAPPVRIQVDKDSGEWLVPVLRGINFSSTQEAEAYIIGHNRSTEKGGWLDGVLADILRDLKDADTPDFSGIGYDPKEIDALISIGDLTAALEGTPVIDPQATEWEGMPEFEQEDLRPHRTIKVHFHDEEGVALFEEKLGRKFYANAKYIWYPDIVIGHYANKLYSDNDTDGEVAIDSYGAKPVTIEHVEGANVPGGHFVFWDHTKENPFLPPMEECNAIELRHSDVVVDIGAYVGTYAIRCARHPVKRVIAYEPTPRSHAVLEMTQLPNLTARQVAVVGDSRPHVELFVSGGIGVTNSIAASRAKAGKVKVPAISFAEAVQDATVVKLDIEGGEYECPIVDVVSAPDSKIRALILDFHPVPGIDWIPKAQAVVDAIEALGFKPLISPEFEGSGWARNGAWERPMADDGSGFEDMVSGKLCCGCAAEVNLDGKGLCAPCFRRWSAKHRKGFRHA